MGSVLLPPPPRPSGQLTSGSQAADTCRHLLLACAQGRVVSFKNTLVLLTSNIGSRVIAASSGGLAAFGSRRSLMGGGEEADEELSKAEQVKSGAGHACCSVYVHVRLLLSPGSHQRLPFLPGGCVVWCWC